MKVFFAVSLSLLATPLVSHASDQLIPAGSLIQCTVAEAKISSKTTAVGDPVLCKLSHVEAYGRSTLPLNSYLVGRFEAYKDPGHFVGKGWMELRFDHMVIQPDIIVPVDARVVSVPKYNVDQEGKILGNGHPVRDIVEWSIPVLWPIDLINLPRRGPSPVLKPETKLTLKLMDDIGIPNREIARDDYPHQPALIERQAPPQQAYASQPQYAPQPQYTQPSVPQQVIYNNYNTPPAPQSTTQVYVQQAPPQQQAPIIIQQQQQQQPQVVYNYPPAPRYVPYGYYPPPPPRYAYPAY
jgi:hypothetical protein